MEHLNSLVRSDGTHTVIHHGIVRIPGEWVNHGMLPPECKLSPPGGIRPMMGGYLPQSPTKELKLCNGSAITSFILIRLKNPAERTHPRRTEGHYLATVIFTQIILRRLHGVFSSQFAIRLNCFPSGNYVRAFLYCHPVSLYESKGGLCRPLGNLKIWSELDNRWCVLY